MGEKELLISQGEVVDIRQADILEDMDGVFETPSLIDNHCLRIDNVKDSELLDVLLKVKEFLETPHVVNLMGRIKHSFFHHKWILLSLKEAVLFLDDLIYEYKPVFRICYYCGIVETKDFLGWSQIDSLHAEIVYRKLLESYGMF